MGVENGLLPDIEEQGQRNAILRPAQGLTPRCIPRKARKAHQEAIYTLRLWQARERPPS
jgi:hypothetical protein